MGALAVSAMRKELETAAVKMGGVAHRDPLGVTVYFTQKADDGEVELRTRVMHSGRSNASVECELVQASKMRCKVLGMFGTLSQLKGMSHTDETMKAPELPPLSECKDAAAILRKTFGDHLPIAQHYDLMLPPKSSFMSNCMRGKQGSDAILEGYARFRDGSRRFTTRSLVYLLDSFPPPVVNMISTPWVPTLTLDLQIFAKPSAADEWLRVRFHTPKVVNGTLVCSGELWSQDGKELYAQSRQLARIMVPKTNKPSVGAVGLQA